MRHPWMRRRRSRPRPSRTAKAESARSRKGAGVLAWGGRGQWSVVRGQRDGGTKQENRKYRKAGKGSDQRTEDGGRRTEGGGQRTEDRGLWTEDRGRRTEDRGEGGAGAFAEATADKTADKEDGGQRGNQYSMFNIQCSMFKWEKWDGDRAQRAQLQGGGRGTAVTGHQQPSRRSGTGASGSRQEEGIRERRRGGKGDYWNPGRAGRSRVAKRSSRVSARRMGTTEPSGRRSSSAERVLPL